MLRHECSHAKQRCATGEQEQEWRSSLARGRRIAKAARKLMTLPYPHISPELVRVGPFAIRWYGVMDLVGFIVGYRIAPAPIARGLVVMTEPVLDALLGYLTAGIPIRRRTPAPISSYSGPFPPP